MKNWQFYILATFNVLVLANTAEHLWVKIAFGLMALVFLGFAIGELWLERTK